MLENKALQNDSPCHGVATPGPHRIPFGAPVAQEKSVSVSLSVLLETLLTVREVAERLRLSTATVYKLCASGKLPHVRVSNAVRVRVADLAVFMRER